MEKWKDFNETEKVTINPSKLEGIDYDYVGRGIVKHFEDNPKRHKIRAKKSLEHEIDEERKRVTMNTFAVGATVLATTVCTIATINVDLEISQRIGTLLLGTISSKGIYDSSKLLNDSVKRKLKLENTYFDKYGQEYEEKRGRSL